MNTYNQLHIVELIETAKELSELLFNKEESLTKFEWELQDEVYALIDEYYDRPDWTEEDEESYFGRGGTYESSWLNR